ncbi:1-deoxy-D-xylulose 5-phosphate reductoisomerase [Listeria floridensis FSL S10-1187]|uniref:1-deoxy-D-xylulose 5-phosphate reductoisomerase n=1 Tax=Listeria floridensis FSL S10-1187 TaxID=1265817 RepID=A0ABP3B0W3_9LIST|nr:1-deoxy-D-xylulose 5-phosphate reductoisomerase [Listeria floridensis FSL S10-1187]
MQLLDFLNGQVDFYNIEAVVENAMNHHAHDVVQVPSLDTILQVDQETRAYAKTLL